MIKDSCVGQPEPAFQEQEELGRDNRAAWGDWDLWPRSFDSPRNKWWTPEVGAEGKVPGCPLIIVLNSLIGRCLIRLCQQALPPK